MSRWVELQEWLDKVETVLKEWETVKGETSRDR